LIKFGIWYFDESYTTLSIFFVVSTYPKVVMEASQLARSVWSDPRVYHRIPCI